MPYLAYKNNNTMLLVALEERMKEGDIIKDQKFAKEDLNSMKNAGGKLHLLGILFY